MARTSPIHSGYTIINGSGTGSNGNRIDVWVEYLLGQQSISGNYTPITAYFYAALNAAYTSSTSNYQGLNSAFKVGGVAGKGVSNGAYDFTSAGKANLLGSYSGNITHNQDGTKTITLAGSFTTVSSYISGGSVSAEITLPTIPRASAIGATDADVGYRSTVTIVPSSKSFAHSVAYSFGTLSGYLTDGGGISEKEVKLSAVNIPFMIPESFYSQLPNGPSGICTLTCRTYSGSSQVGEAKTCTFRITANEDLCRPVVQGTVVDVNEATLALTGSEHTFIKFMSTARCTMAATVRNQASGIVQKKIAGREISGDTISIGAVETEAIGFEAVDSRGYTGVFEKPIEVLPYVLLTCNASVQRTDPTSGKAVLKLEGNCFKGSFGLSDNWLTITYQINEEEPVILPVVPSDQNSFSVQVALSGLDYTAAHTVTVTAEDALTVVTKRLAVQKGAPVFDWGESDFNFNVPVYLQGAPLADFVVEQEASDGWTWRKWNSGVAECWFRGSNTFTYGANENGLYLGYGTAIFPFAFVRQPTVTYSVYATNGYDFSGKSVILSDRFNFYIGSTSDLSGKTEVQLVAYAIGRWKE